jgi:uncharacterized protein with HEPN domain
MRREERDPAWLADMLQAAREALVHAGEMTREEFLADLRTQRAVELMIMIIGEAAAQVSDESRTHLPNLPWRQIVAMRNRLVHHYFRIDLDLVWDVIRNDLPVLISALEAMELESH